MYKIPQDLFHHKYSPIYSLFTKNNRGHTFTNILTQIRIDRHLYLKWKQIYNVNVHVNDFTGMTHLIWLERDMKIKEKLNEKVGFKPPQKCSLPNVMITQPLLMKIVTYFTQSERIQICEKFPQSLLEKRDQF